MQLTRRRMDTDIEHRWVLQGPHGAVEYHQPRDDGQPSMGLGVEVHAIRPQYNEDNPSPCDIYGTCYVDGSSIAAARAMRRHREGGEEGLWGELQRRYEAVFGGEQQ